MSEKCSLEFRRGTAALFGAFARLAAQDPERAVVAAQWLEKSVDSPVDDLELKFATLGRLAGNPADQAMSAWLLFLTLFFPPQWHLRLWIGPDLGSGDFGEGAASEDRLRLAGSMIPAESESLRECFSLIAEGLGLNGEILLETSGDQAAFGFSPSV